jgi:hypothetical protein
MSKCWSFKVNDCVPDSVEGRIENLLDALGDGIEAAIEEAEKAIKDEWYSPEEVDAEIAKAIAAHDAGQPVGKVGE